MIDYIKHFDSNKTMFFKVIDKELLKRYIKILERINNLICKEFESELVYGDNDRYIKTKIKSYGNKVNTDFQRKKIPKENALYKCLSLIVLGPGNCLKGQFGVIRQLSGGKYWTSMKQLISNPSLRKLNFYQRLKLGVVELVNKFECLCGLLDDKMMNFTFWICALIMLWRFSKISSHLTLPENCAYSKLLWSVLSHIWIEYGEVRSVSPYWVQMRENTD